MEKWSFYTITTGLKTKEEWKKKFSQLWRTKTSICFWGAEVERSEDWQGWRPVTNLELNCYFMLISRREEHSNGMSCVCFHEEGGKTESILILLITLASIAFLHQLCPYSGNNKCNFVMMTTNLVEEGWEEGQRGISRNWQRCRASPAFIGGRV